MDDYEYIPDPIELGEARAERWADENIHGDLAKCPDCGEWCDLSGMLPMSPDPYSPPICSECAGFEPQ